MRFHLYRQFFLAALLASRSVTAEELKPNPVATEEIASSPIIANETSIITFTNSSWEDKIRPDGVYDSPYKIALFSTPNGEDGERLWSQTKSVAWYGIGVASFLTLLPRDTTNWDESNDKLLEKWWDNVREGPAWDRDSWDINYISHPYFGGVYYQSARKSGYRQWDAFIYSALMSTFYWEYGIEAFAEVPALQDLVVTPVLGWVYGEWAFNQERDIILSGGTVWGSAVLGDTALFFLDPIDSIGRGINQLVGKEVVRAGTGYIGFQEITLSDGSTETQVKANLRYGIGSGKGNSTKAHRDMHDSAAFTEDPVNFGIVGISVGSAYLDLDESWDLENGWAPTFTLGLYFTPQISSRLSYSRGEMKEKTSADRVTYENYSIDMQYYFNVSSDFRPYVTGGLGEALKDKDRGIKTFQINAGLGLHYKLDRNWALQLDWHHYYGTKFSANDALAYGQLIYRFGDGETAF
jgi:opacity protein-like surface antigen